LTLEDIKRYQKAFADSSKLAIEAGMDGIELHGARKPICLAFFYADSLDGYLIDQFTQASSNNRTDEYGGSIENRIRFALETLQACADAIGEERVGIRLSPYSHFQGMSNPDNIEVFTKLCEAIHERFPKFGYVHMVESRGDPAKLANWATESGDAPDAETLNPFRKIFEGSPTAFLSAGGYTADLAREVVKAHGGAVVFGRIFISSEFKSCRLMS
jgi:2,4-dienoyl-CoA reductase-like NADH-dependent reductase (Old Yellow Enzyme family)